jgi:LmbE family N-acetylglucosaminyl deacetylase
MPHPTRILCLHAHPDDAEIFAGGTLALLAQLGHRVTVATMTAGDCGSVEHGPDEIARIRLKEAAEGARRLGAAYDCLGFRDLEIFLDNDARRRVTAALRRHRPDLIITSSPADYHCDHEATSRLVLDACFACSAPNYDTRRWDPAPALERIPHLYFADPAEGTDREGRVIHPELVVDVEPVFSVKRKALAAHESQRGWLMRQHGMDDYLQTMEEWCVQRGALAGLRYGEGFRQYTGHPWPRTPLLEDLLGGRVRRIGS